MKHVILTVGPRGAGKTTFCRQIVSERPEIVIVERDEILIKLFGGTSLCPYSGGHEYGKKVLLAVLEEHLNQESTTIILDTWSGFPDDRKTITRRLRSMGVDRIEAWYFVTSEAKVVKQFIEREMREKPPQTDSERRSLNFRVDMCFRDFNLYHSQGVTEEQGFDKVCLINPDQLTLVPYSELLVP
ncbi:MAG: AAA family ATPase [bacterium]|nr:AAA family ATPase [bacterium]